MARRLTFVFSALLCGQLATSSCAGPKFSPGGDCDGDSCEAGSGGSDDPAGRGGTGGVGGSAESGKGGSVGRGGSSGASSGGKAGAGQSGSAGDGSGGAGAMAGNGAGGAGTAASGGAAGTNGAGMGSVAGTDAGGSGGMDPGFPLTTLLDDFEQPEVFDDRWIGSVQNFTVANGVLTCVDCPHAALHEEELGADQEVYVTLAGFDANAAEINLILLAQNEICELVEVLYSPLEQVLKVNTCFLGMWELHGSTPATLAAGDRFGARLHSDGTVQVFVNGEERLSAAVGALENDDGHIGVSGNTADPLVFDDFGGGEWR